MLGKLNSTLLISIGVALVLCAAVYYVNNARMNRIESAINRQNQVLTAFIANVQNEIRGGALRQVQQPSQQNELSPDVSSEEARNSVAKQMLIQEQQIPRIVVSDNEDSTSEEEDETDTEETDVADSDSDDSVSETDTENKEVINTNDADCTQEELVNNEVHHIKIVDIHNLGELPMFISEFKLESLDDLANNSSITELASASEEDESDCEDSESESEAEASASDAEADHANNEVVHLDIIEEIKTIKLDIEPSEETNTSANEVETVEVAAVEVENEVVLGEDTSKLSSEEELQQLNYEHLKVDELRKIALDLNKATKDEVKKLKKPELLYLLKA